MDPDPVAQYLYTGDWIWWYLSRVAAWRAAWAVRRADASCRTWTGGRCTPCAYSSYISHTGNLNRNRDIEI